MDLDKILKEKLINIHLHTFSYGYDHLPLSLSDKNKEKWVKGILFIKKIKYTGTIVLEYGLNEMNGSNDEEKLIDYIKSAQIANNYF
jgi:hypothetical protein